VGHLFALSAVVSCSNPAPPAASTPAGRVSAPSGRASASSAPDASSTAPPIADRARVITVHASLFVDDVEAGLASLRGLVASHHGYVEEATAQLAHDGSALLHVRVPSDELTSFRSAVAELGDIASERETAEDVTEQRADLDARVRNAGAEEQRLLELLAQRTGDLADVLAVEAQLSRVRESIERMQAQQRVLERNIGYASVHLDIATHPVAFSDTPGRSIASAAEKGFAFAWSMLVGITMLVAGVAPVALLWFAMGLLLVLTLRLLSRLRRRAPRAA